MINPDIFRPINVPDRIRPYVRRVLVSDVGQAIDMNVDVYATGYHYLGWIWRGRWLGEVNGVTAFDSDTDGTVMEWIPPLNGIAMCQNGEVSPSNEEGIHSITVL